MHSASYAYQQAQESLTATVLAGVSLITGLEYGMEWNGGMEWWNGKWNGMVNVHSDIYHVWLALFNLVRVTYYVSRALISP